MAKNKNPWTIGPAKTTVTADTRTSVSPLLFDERSVASLQTVERYVEDQWVVAKIDVCPFVVHAQTG